MGSGQGRIDAIYVSPDAAQPLTAAPLAARLRLTPDGRADRRSARAWRIACCANTPAAEFSIVGHGNTVPAIVAALSGASDIPPIGAQDYGTMYIVTVPRIGHANYLRLTY